MISQRAIGDVRASQLVTTFGPGAVVDLSTLSIIVAGVDNWSNDPELIIHEPRLQRALKIDHFRTAKPATGSYFNRLGTIPSYIFPRYQVCPICKTISRVDEGFVKYDPKTQELTCNAPNCKGLGKGKRRAVTIPAPFIVACPGGHIDDFPWREYVHQGPSQCRLRMKFYSEGRTGSVSDLMVECDCGVKRNMTAAFGEQKYQTLGPCTRRRPWLGPNNIDDNPCRHANRVEALQRGATNIWFPVTRSALAVKDSATPIGYALSQCDPHQLSRIDSPSTLEHFVNIERRLQGFEVEEIWQALLNMRGEIQTDQTDLHWPEWLAFRDDPRKTCDKNEFYLEKGEVPSLYSSRIARIVGVRKLLEVRALLGFTRIDQSSSSIVNDGPLSDLAPIYREQQNWLPAVEVRGEGIFIELNEDAVALWEAKQEVKDRAAAMAEKYAEWQRQKGANPSNFPGARYILLHSFAHTMIRQLALDCGYSASSVRERIYSSTDEDRKMCGVLLYTASADSEGSLGGLVDLATPNRFPDLINSALNAATHCSSDPLCADHQPDIHASINGAACHSCLFVSETSCESFNLFLDRSVIANTISNDKLSYFAMPYYG